ncbi:MAG: cation transporter [Campylobacterales bacterium]
MKQRVYVQNLKCGGCANTITKRLSEEFEEVEVDVVAKTVTLKANEEQMERVRELLKSLGYPVVGEAMGFVEEKVAQAKSFVSCAIGRFSQDS